MGPAQTHLILADVTQMRPAQTQLILAGGLPITHLTVNNTCRGYPEPTITWQREDKQNIVLRDGAGNIHKGEYNSIHTYVFTGAG
jgi:hypothetical protein